MIGRFLLLATLTTAIGSANAADKEPLSRQVGTNPGLFTLKDATTGKDVALESFHGKKAGVLVFMGVDCPVGNQYLPRLNEIAKSYGEKGVVVLGINSNAHESVEKIAQHAKEFNLAFPVLRDEGSKIADQYQAVRTCEVILLDDKAVIRYRGAIDDQYGYGTQKPKPVKNLLTEALDALLDGKQIDTTGTSVVGCPIDRADRKTDDKAIPRIRAAAPAIVEALKDEPEVKVGQVNYASDVALIIQNKCQSCHRPKAAAPFPLLTYDHAKRWAASIREVVDERRMPPWHADPRYSHFDNDRRLSPKERATLIAWVDQGAPLGDAKNLPAEKTYPEGWAVGTPDQIFEMPAEYVIPAEGVVRYQYFKIPLNFTEERWVQSIECLPGSREAVHHIIAYLNDGKTRDLEQMEHLGGYAPGELPCVYKPGMAKRIPAGSQIILQVHYTPMGKVAVDRSKVGLIFAKNPPTQEAHTLGIANTQFKIPPGADNHEVKSSFTFDKDSHLLSFMPHMHLRGKDFQYTVTYPGKQPEILLSVPAYDFAWQSYYRLAEPLPMPKGTVINCVAHFDNSEKNPANPDPKKSVRWGDQTFEEMMIGYIDFYVDEPIKFAEPKK